jgi:hypothetical protein
MHDAPCTIHDTYLVGRFFLVLIASILCSDFRLSRDLNSREVLAVLIAKDILIATGAGCASSAATVRHRH